MAGFNVESALGIADDDHVIWPTTRAAIERTGFRLEPAPGTPTSKLGEGAFATVFYAEHVVNKRPAAIKVFHTEDKDLLEKDLLESFQRESKTVEAPDFPREFAAETYLSCHEPGAQPFLVLEYVRGQPIDEYVTDHKPSREVRIERIEQLLAGVQALHERNITHRDLSWRNVLVDQRGKVRLLDFGEAGEIVRAKQQTTLRNPLGNRECSPGEQLRGEIRAGDREDIFNCAMIAVCVLTGKSPPPNERSGDERSGDPRHVAACRRQLREAHVPGSLARIILQGLQTPDRRYRLAKGMADDLFDHRVRRPQRRRTWGISLAVLAVCAIVAAVGWWQYAESQQAWAEAQYRGLTRQAGEMKFAADPTIAKRLQDLGQWEDEWNGQKVRRDPAAWQTLARITAALEETIRINAGLERSYPRREALGTALQAMPWVEKSPVIKTKKQAAEAAYKQINDLLAAGKIDEAWTLLDTLQKSLAQLTRENALAALAADAQRQHATAAAGISDRLRGLPDFAVMRELADHGQRAWEAGDWQLAQRDYGQARQRLDEFLTKNETPEETAAREKASLEVLRTVEQERQRYQPHIDQLTAERDQ
jgi:hypothetical protein